MPSGNEHVYEGFVQADYELRPGYGGIQATSNELSDQPKADSSCCHRLTYE